MKLRPGLIAFEGTECAGKTTAIKSIARWIEETFDQEVVITRAPGGTPIGQQIRSIVVGDDHDKMSPTVNALLFAADWRHTLETVVKPAIERGAVVLTDRCNLTCWVYQYSSPEIQKLTELNTRYVSADVIFVMTTPFDVFVERRDARDASLNNARDYVEREVFEGMVTRYLQYADTHPKNVVAVDCIQSPDEILKDLKRVVKDRLLSQGK